MLPKIFGFICAIQCAVGNFNFSQKFVPPNRINLTLNYGQFSILKFKFGGSDWITSKNDGVITLNGIQPCTRYDIQAIILDNFEERNQNNYFITDIESRPQVFVTADLDSITIDLNYTNIDCYNNLTIVIDNSKMFLYQRQNLSRPLLIPDLLPCVNYSVKISLSHKSGKIDLYNDYITTKPMKLERDEILNYNSTKCSVKWPSDQSENWSTKDLLKTTSYNNYRLNARANYQVLNKSTECKIPASRPKAPILVFKNCTTLQITSKYVPSKIDECEIEMFHFTCKNETTSVWIHRSIYYNKGIGVMKNLKSNTVYHCNVIVKNDKFWSTPSLTAMLSTNNYTKLPDIELYLNSVTSKSINVSWTTSLKITKIQINKINFAGVLHPHCKPIRYYFVEKVTNNNKSNKIFYNLEPYTNYVIQVGDLVKMTVTTGPDVPHQVNNLKIVNITSESVTISFELPCITNGRIEQFVGKFYDSLNNTSFIWKLPFDIKTELYTSTINFEEKNILPGRNYKITVGIQLYNFVRPINESIIDFVLPDLVTTTTLPPTLPPNSSVHWVIVVLIIFVFVLVTISGGGIWYYKFRKNQTETPLNSTYIELKCFENNYKLIDDECKSMEFYTIETMNDSRTISMEVAEGHRAKNRYLDITPYDYNRVILTPNEYCTSDYINASFIDGYKRENQYIATQGPKEETVYEFWHMVIEKKCNKIVMLTRTIENSVGKCFQYFPLEKEKLKFGNILIRNIQETDFGNFIRRELVLGKGAALRSIIHYQYVTWPDRGCPQNELDLIEFIEFTKSMENKSSNPMIVHCSAGVGRTGTFIALDILLQGFRNDKFVSVYETVKKLRLQRCFMVQTSVQYHFVYAAINKYYLRRMYKGKQEV